MQLFKDTTKNPLNLPPSKVFVIDGGSDSVLWGDINSTKDDLWQESVWKTISDNIIAKKEEINKLKRWGKKILKEKGIIKKSFSSDILQPYEIRTILEDISINHWNNVEESLKHPGHSPQSVHGRRRGHTHLGDIEISPGDKIGNANKPTKETKANTDKLKEFIGKRVPLSVLDKGGIESRNHEKNTERALDNIVKESGLSEDFVRGQSVWWAGDSNDSLGSLIQKGVERNFEVPLSDWQKEKFPADLTKNPKWWNDGIYASQAAQIEEMDKYVTSTYRVTQEQLASIGLKPDDEVTLYRGIVTNGELYNSDIGTTVDYNGNAIESWTLEAGVASSFANHVAKNFPEKGQHVVTLSVNVPVKNIFGTPRSAIGTFFQSEVVIFGSLGGEARLHKKGEVRTNN